MEELLIDGSDEKQKMVKVKWDEWERDCKRYFDGTDGLTDRGFVFWTYNVGSFNFPIKYVEGVIEMQNILEQLLADYYGFSKECNNET